MHEHLMGGAWPAYEFLIPWRKQSQSSRQAVQSNFGPCATWSGKRCRNDCCNKPWPKTKPKQNAHWSPKNKGSPIWLQSCIRPRCKDENHREYEDDRAGLDFFTYTSILTHKSFYTHRSLFIFTLLYMCHRIFHFCFPFIIGIICINSLCDLHLQQLHDQNHVFHFHQHHVYQRHQHIIHTTPATIHTRGYYIKKPDPLSMTQRLFPEIVYGWCFRRILASKLFVAEFLQISYSSKSKCLSPSLRSKRSQVSSIERPFLVVAHQIDCFAWKFLPIDCFWCPSGSLGNPARVNAIRCAAFRPSSRSEMSTTVLWWHGNIKTFENEHYFNPIENEKRLLTNPLFLFSMQIWNSSSQRKRWRPSYSTKTTGRSPSLKIVSVNHPI